MLPELAVGAVLTLMMLIIFAVTLWVIFDEDSKHISQRRRIAINEQTRHSH